MNILSYEDFLKESAKNEFNDILSLLDELKDKPIKDILQLRDVLKSELKNVNESINEGFIENLKNKIKRTFDDLIFKYLVNRKKEYYENVINSLDIFDLTSLKNIPGINKIESIYLAGGMDKALDTGAGWRSVVEFEFEKYGKPKEDLPEIEISSFGKMKPKRIVDTVFLSSFISKPKEIKKLYNFPLILNPGRIELDRTKNMNFIQGMENYKKIDYKSGSEKYTPYWFNIIKTMTGKVEPNDEHLVRLADAIFLGLNKSAAAGTYGELQMASFLNRPIFVYMTDKNWEFKDFSTWTFPHISKLVRNEAEMKILVKTILSYVK